MLRCDISGEARRRIIAWFSWSNGAMTYCSSCETCALRRARRGAKVVSLSTAFRHVAMTLDCRPCMAMRRIARLNLGSSDCSLLLGGQFVNGKEEGVVRRRTNDLSVQRCPTCAETTRNRRNLWSVRRVREARPGASTQVSASELRDESKVRKCVTQNHQCRRGPDHAMKI